MPRIEQAKRGERKLLFMDAAHFVHGAFLATVWCFVRFWLPSPCGRKRFNVLGAIDAINQELHVVTNTAYINAESVCKLLRLIADKLEHIPITIVLDNARYQRCKLVQNLAEQLGIELLFLPSYSPNLNLIERLWKWVKNKCLYGKYYETFDLFKQGIENTLQTVALPDTKEELKTLLNLKFQTFEKTQIMTN